MSAMLDQGQSNHQTANPKIWGLMEKTEMKSTNGTITRKLNNFRNPTKFHPIRTLAVLALV